MWLQVWADPFSLLSLSAASASSSATNGLSQPSTAAPSSAAAPAGAEGGKEKKSTLRTPSYTDRILTHSLPGASVQPRAQQKEAGQRGGGSSSSTAPAFLSSLPPHPPHATNTLSPLLSSNPPPLPSQPTPHAMRTGKQHHLVWRQYEMADGLELTDHRPVCAALDLRVDVGVRGFRFPSPQQQQQLQGQQQQQLPALPPPAPSSREGMVEGGDDLGLFHIHVGRPRLESA